MKHFLLLGCFLAAASAAVADEPAKDAPLSATYRITGLFSPDREADLREAVGKLPQVKLVAVDFANAEATLEFVPAKAFPGAKPVELVDRLNNAVRSASNHTLGVQPRSTTPRDKLETVEIRVRGLDCKACSLAAYETINKLDGVEVATVSFRDGRVVAKVDPARVDRAKLVEALKKLGVEVP